MLVGHSHVMSGIVTFFVLASVLALPCVVPSLQGSCSNNHFCGLFACQHVCCNRWWMTILSNIIIHDVLGMKRYSFSKRTHLKFYVGAISQTNLFSVRRSFQPKISVDQLKR